VIKSDETLTADASSVAIAFLTASSLPDDTTDAQFNPSKRSEPLTITVSDAEIGGMEGAGRNDGEGEDVCDFDDVADIVGVRLADGVGVVLADG